jgi:uncharacterized ion transporter superfamily protein YfcC
LLGRLGVAGTADAFAEGFKSMALAGLLVGFARAIYVVLNEGHIVVPLSDLIGLSRQVAVLAY